MSFLWPFRAAPAPAAETPFAPLRFAVSFSKGQSAVPLDGRILLMESTDASEEPRKQINIGLKTQQIFGLDVDGLPPGKDAIFDALPPSAAVFCSSQSRRW